MDTLATDPVIRRSLDGDGTRAATWAVSGHLLALPSLSARDLLADHARVVVVAPHPDDELLGTGAILAEATALGRPSLVIAVTDGEASHPGSTEWRREALRVERAQERILGLITLGVTAPSVLRLGIDDGEVARHEAEVRSALTGLLRPGDLVLAPWRHDGHPDHDAVGRASVAACADAGIACREVPIWMWHWAAPGDPDVPWHTAKRICVSAELAQRKRAAIAMHMSQLLPDHSTGRDAVLPPSLLSSLCRPYEVVLS